MMFNSTSWNSVNDLINQLLKFSKENNKTPPVEIERKWLVDKNIVSYLKNYHSSNLISHKIMIQGYLSTDPELRYRSVKSVGADNAFTYLGYKTDGGLIREEHEYEIPTGLSLKIAKSIRENKHLRKVNDSKFIQKDYYSFRIDDIKYQISIVDNGKFTYMEVEFDTAEEASSFVIPDEFSKFIIKDVTNDPSYKMKNYWERTRLMK